MIDTSSATKADLAKYLAEEHGVKLGSSATRTDMVTKVQELDGTSQAQAPGDDGSDERVLTHVTLIINKGSLPEEQSDVNPICNGVGYQIKRGVNVKVPAIVYNVLKDATKTVFSESRDGNGAKVYNPSEVHSYSFSVIEKHYAA